MGLTISSLLIRCFSKKKNRISMVGLDGAGKSTILYNLRFGEIITTTPAPGFTIETIEIDNNCITVWDLTGRLEIRTLWRNYFQDTRGLIFVVDSSDRDRIALAGNELSDLLDNDMLRNVPLLIFANKQDLPNAMKRKEIIEKLRLTDVRNRRWFIQKTCAPYEHGISEGLDWLSYELGRNY